MLETGDPLKALHLVRAQQSDLLLTDVVMPLMKGTELADRVQRVSPLTKAVLMSGYTTADIAPSGRSVLAKAFAIERLSRCIREMLERPSACARPPSSASKS